MSIILAILDFLLMYITLPLIVFSSIAVVGISVTESIQQKIKDDESERAFIDLSKAHSKVIRNSIKDTVNTEKLQEEMPAEEKKEEIQQEKAKEEPTVIVEPIEIDIDEEFEEKSEKPSDSKADFIQEDTIEKIATPPIMSDAKEPTVKEKEEEHEEIKESVEVKEEMNEEPNIKVQEEYVEITHQTEESSDSSESARDKVRKTFNISF